MSTPWIPDGYHSVTPYLIVTGVPRLLEFLTQAFAAEELLRALHPDGSVMHAEVRIGDSVVMMGEAGGEWKPMPGGIYLFVPDVDAVHQRALEAGATLLMEPADQPYGHRMGGVKDPSGNYWWLATPIPEPHSAE